jgi:hypothetical protein
VTCVLDGKSLIVTENIVNGQHVERALPTTLLITERNIPMSETFDYYEYTATGDRAIRTGPGATYPRVDNGSARSYFLTSKKARGKATSEDRVILGSDAATFAGYPNDIWVRVYVNDGVLVDGWTAKIHKGVTQVTEIFVPTVEPPPATEKILKSFDFHIEAETKTAKTTVLYTDGTSEVKNYKTA